MSKPVLKPNEVGTADVPLPVKLGDRADFVSEDTRAASLMCGPPREGDLVWVPAIGPGGHIIYWHVREVAEVAYSGAVLAGALHHPAYVFHCL